MARRRTRPWSEIIPALIILLIFGLVGVFVGIRDAREEAKAREEAAERQAQEEQQRKEEEEAAAAYHDTMLVLDKSGYTCSLTADKAVAWMLESKEDPEGTYSKEYIPEEYLADSPDQVRYRIHFIYGENKVGFYSGDSNAYQRKYTIRVEDLTTGEILDEVTILGGDPPASAKPGSGHQYGGYPREDKVQEWITGVLSGT